MSDLLGYLLKIDEPEQRERAEALLRDDPAAVRELALWQKLVEPLEADRDGPAPPKDLIARTIGRVAEHICASGTPVPPPAGPTTEELISRMSPERWRNVLATLDRAEAPVSRWRRADFIVLASIIIVGLGLALAALPYLRYRQNVTACQNHLRQLYHSLDAYADLHQNRFPQVGEDPPYNTAASFVSELQLAGVLPSPAESGCPAGPGELVTYAYTLGHADETGRLRGPMRDPDQPGWGYLPLAADRPALGRRTPNPDHGSGQNVLFAGGNVRFCTSANVGIDGDDIYRNQLGMVGRGVNVFDAVLGVGGDRP